MAKKQILFKRGLSLVLAIVAMLTAIPATHAFAMQADSENQQSSFSEDVATTVSENEGVALASEPESTFNGGWGITTSSLPVYDDKYGTNRIGSVFTQEGFTILRYTYEYTYIEYSTSSGPKRGYLVGYNLAIAGDTTYASVGKITSTCNVYYGTNESTYRKAGAVYADETVVILAKNSYWAYIEYNTTAGRKRGYIYSNCVQSYNTPSSGTWGSLYTLRTPSNMSISGTQTVYSGPSRNYAAVGSVTDETVIKRGEIWLIGDYEAWYVEYNTSTGLKSGFILGW